MLTARGSHTAPDPRDVQRTCIIFCPRDPVVSSTSCLYQQGSRWKGKEGASCGRRGPQNPSDFHFRAFQGQVFWGRTAEPPQRRAAGTRRPGLGGQRQSLCLPSRRRRAARDVFSRKWSHREAAAPQLAQSCPWRQPRCCWSHRRYSERASSRIRAANSLKGSG